MISDYGTEESRKRANERVSGCMVIQNRGATQGGQVISTGIANAAPDTLEMMFFKGHLRGKGESLSDAHRRRDNGRAFQELHAVFASKGKEAAAALATYRQMTTLEGHVESANDIAETLYNDTLKMFDAHQRRIILAVLIDNNMIVTSYGLVCKLLDALPRKMEQAEHALKEKIENRKKDSV